MKRQASREVACSGKGALTAPQAKKLARRLREKGDRVVPYKCIHCGRFHVGNSLMTEGMRGRAKTAPETERWDG